MIGRERVEVVSEAGLVERARQGDRQAFDVLVRSHLPRVWRVVWRILRHHEDTEDVVQEVFLAAHQALLTFRGESRFSTWLHRIAVNRALNHLTEAGEQMRRGFRSLGLPPDEGEEGLHRAVRGIASLSAADPSPLREMEMEELRRRLALCLSKVPAAWRAVLSLRIEESLSYEEIARVLGTALGTVRSRLARARLALRRCVMEEAA